MTETRILASATVEYDPEGAWVWLKTDKGARLRYGPFRPEGVEAALMHLGSALAMTALRYQTVLRAADFGPEVHQHELPEQTSEDRAEIAARLAEAMARDGISQPLFADMLGFLGMPAGTGPTRLAHLLKAIDAAYRR